MLTYDRAIAHLERGLVLAAAMTLLLGACAPSPGNQAAAPLTGTAEEAIPPTLSPTKAPPTEVPTEAPTPTPELGPEVLATSSDEVVGKWRMKMLGGGGGGDLAVFTLSADGTYSMDGVGGEHDGMNVGAGTYRFEGEVFVFDSKDCLKPGPTDKFFACLGKYNVFSAAADGKPAQLRFVAIDDPAYFRLTSLDGKTLSAYVTP
jgi:hypothetical protein